jgi:acetylornithine deacetylase
VTLDPVALTRELVQIPSPTGEEAAVVDFMERTLRGLGYTVQRQPVANRGDNLYATLEPPVVVLSSHLDVVPPHLPFREDDEWLHGRGSCDAKGIVATMVAAAQAVRDQGERRVGLLFVVGEETGGDGARAAATLEPKGRFLINGEPTENKLSIGQKGAICLDLIARGKAAHSGYPEEGVSATEALLDALERIRAIPLPSDPLLGTTTLNIGQLAGGVAPNVIPDRASATLMFRTVGAHQPLVQAVRAAAGPAIAVERRFEFPPVRSTPLPGWETTVVKYASDLAHLTSWGAGYQLGPGSILVAHTLEERVRKAELHEGVRQYVRLVGELLGTR